MKYTIHGFNQKIAIELGLNNDDLLFLRWLSDFSNTGAMERKEIKGTSYYWVNYQTVCEELPILATKKDTLYRKLKKLCESKVLKHETVKNNGTYSYYGFGSAFLSLVSDTFYGGYGKKSVGGTEKNPKGVRKKIPTKDSSIILNSSIKYNQLVSSEPQENINDELTNLFNQSKLDMYEDEALKTSIKETIKELYLDTASRDKVKKIDLYNIDEAISRYREAQEQKSIKNPKLYFKKCLLSAIEEGGLTNIV